MNHLHLCYENSSWPDRSPHPRKPRLWNSRNRSPALGSCNADMRRCFSASPMFDSLTKLPDTAMESSRFSTLCGQPAGTKSRQPGVSSTLGKDLKLGSSSCYWLIRFLLQRPNEFCSRLSSNISKASTVKTFSILSRQEIPCSPRKEFPAKKVLGCAPDCRNLLLVLHL